MNTFKAIFENRRTFDEMMPLVASFAAGVIVCLAVVDFM